MICELLQLASSSHRAGFLPRRPVNTKAGGLLPQPHAASIHENTYLECFALHESAFLSSFLSCLIDLIPSSISDIPKFLDSYSQECSHRPLA